MAYTFGFYDAVNGDRRYSAEQLSSIFNGIINDGVFDNVGNMMTVIALNDDGNKMGVGINTGRAWFDGTWTNVSSIETDGLVLANAPATAARIDTVVLETNFNQGARRNTFKIIQGSIAGNPTPPALTNDNYVKQHPLAYIRVNAGTTQITQSMITNNIGTSLCPLVTGILETADITNLIKQWNGQFDDWMLTNGDTFYAWYEALDDIFKDGSDVDLASRIIKLEQENAIMRGSNVITLKPGSAGWGTTIPFTQTITTFTVDGNEVAITNMKATDTPIIEAYIPDDLEAGDEEDYLEQCGYVTKFETGVNRITVYCYSERPDMKLQFSVKGR